MVEVDITLTLFPPTPRAASRVAGTAGNGLLAQDFTHRTHMAVFDGQYYPVHPRVESYVYSRNAVFLFACFEYI